MINMEITTFVVFEPSLTWSGSFYVYAVYVHTVEEQVQINGASSNHDDIAGYAGACRVTGSPVQ